MCFHQSYFNTQWGPVFPWEPWHNMWKQLQWYFTQKKPALALKLLLQTRKSILINLYTFMEIFYPQNFYSTGRPRKCADCGTERWGCENDDTMTGQLKSAIKLIYAPGGWRDLDNLGTTKVCLALHQEMELLGCNIKFIKNQIFG